MTDYALLGIYALVAILSICIFALILLLSILVFLLSKKHPEESYDYLKNIVYATFGGIIAIILLELKGESIFNIYFWTIKVPLTLLLVLVFIICGFLYLYALKRIFFWINPKLKKNEKQNTN